MRAGWLRHRIDVLEKDAVRNDYGEPIETWATLVTLWASVEPLRGQEYRESRLQAQANSHRIRVRYYAGLSAENRIRFKGRIFEIESVIAPLEKRDLMELMCREMV